MAGCRPLTKEEINQVYYNLTCTRDRVMFRFGLLTGFRISEILSIKVKDVYQHDKIVDRVRVSRSNMKGNFTRDVVLSEALKTSIMELIMTQGLIPDDYLFKSRKGNKAISRVQAWTVLTKAFDASKMTGNLGCHALRKTFAGQVFKALEYDLIRTQKALGHESITSTIAYLPLNEEEVDQAILSLE